MKKRNKIEHPESIRWWVAIILLIIIISVLHYTTPTSKWQNHLVYMQSYFIPILIASFQFGIRGGLGIAIAVSIIYLPHIMLQWGGLIESNLMRFMQIVLYNVIGFLTGLKAQREKEEKAKLKTTADQLENSLRTVKQQSDKLIELEEQVCQADRLAVIGELTSSLAHEVRNPLGSIRGAVEIILDKDTDQNKKDEFYHILIEETARLSSVLENYLSFAKKRKQTDSEYIFQEIIENVVMMLGTTARKSRTEIIPVMPNDPFLLKGDPNDLWQILMNIILNALQAMTDGGTVKISLTQLDPLSIKDMTDLKFNENYRYLRLTITDNGPGISDEEQHKIFEPFYTTKAGGSGLGLAIVKRIVDDNNWIINVDSQQASGTVFVIIIPIEKKFI